MNRTIKEILTQTKTIAVVGLSSDPTRASFGVSRYMQKQGYRIIPINPKETSVLGEPAYPSIADVPPEIKIDLVNVFRRPDQTPSVAREAIARGASALWLQLDIASEAAAQLAQSAGLDFVQDECIMIHHSRLRA